LDLRPTLKDKTHGKGKIEKVGRIKKNPMGNP